MIWCTFLCFHLVLLKVKSCGCILLKVPQNFTFVIIYRNPSSYINCLYGTLRVQYTQIILKSSWQFLKVLDSQLQLPFNYLLLLVLFTNLTCTLIRFLNKSVVLCTGMDLHLNQATTCLCPLDFDFWLFVSTLLGAHGGTMPHKRWMAQMSYDSWGCCFPKSWQTWQGCHHHLQLFAHPQANFPKQYQSGLAKLFVGPS